MTTTDKQPTPGHRGGDALLSHSVRTHLLIVGIALFIIGVLTLWFLPEAAAVWLIVAVVVVAHIGLLMAVGATVLRWFAKRHSGR